MHVDIRTYATFHRLSNGKIRAVVTLKGDLGGREQIIRTSDQKTAEEALSWATALALDAVKVSPDKIHEVK